MARPGVTELHECLGFRDYGESGHRARAVFRYEPLLRLYKLELPRLFGLLLRDERDETKLLDRADPKLFETEMDELLEKYGPLIWPALGEGSREHLLEPKEGTRYTSDLEYPRDSVM
jgi:hypothetical protein